MGFNIKSNGTKQKKESILFRAIFVFCFRIVLVLLQISFFYFDWRPAEAMLATYAGCLFLMASVFF